MLCLQFRYELLSSKLFLFVQHHTILSSISCIVDIKVKSDHRNKFSNLSNWKEEAWKNQGFNGIRTHDLHDTGAMLYKLSCEATHWERDQFIDFISSREEWNDVKSLKIIHIWTAVIDESEEWSSHWKIYCNDHSSLSTTTAVQIWIISYILHFSTRLHDL